MKSIADKFYSVGRVKDALGLKGDIYIKLRSQKADWIDDIKEVVLSDSETPKNLKSFKNFKFKKYKEGLAVKFDEVNDRTHAESLKGLYMLIPRDVLITSDENNFFLYEVLNFKVIDEVLGEIGTVSGFGSNGAQDLLIVLREKGDVAIPFIKEFTRQIDFKNKLIVMTLPEGLVEINDI
jgi:16S rRNA processing protein RimM